jgi:hypothetical protein
MATTTGQSKPIHPDIPVESAWQVGRRIYVPAPYDSPLNDGLYDMGSTWDRETRVRWVGSGKKQQVIDLLGSLKPEPVADDVPMEKAWRTGGRLYVRCGAQSQLNADLKPLGAQWNADTRAVWVPVRQSDAALVAIRAGQERIRRIEAVKALGLWLDLPPDAERVRDRAKELGAIYDKGHGSQWAFPSTEARREVQTMRDMWITERDELERLDRETREAAERREQEIRAARRREKLIANSGRTVTGETAELREISTRFMRRADADAAARPLGSIVRLPDGRRGLVAAVDVWFTGSEYASSVCWHPETHDEAHWDFLYRLEIVAPTDAERATDERRVAEAADAAAIHELVDNAGALTGARCDDRWTTIPDADRAGTIVVTVGVTGMIRGGHLILTRGGRVIWQHPGHYDEYVKSEGITTDPQLAERVRALLAAGPRERVVTGVQPTYYRVEVADA